MGYNVSMPNADETTTLLFKKMRKQLTHQLPFSSLKNQASGVVLLLERQKHSHANYPAHCIRKQFRGQCAPTKKASTPSTKLQNVINTNQTQASLLIMLMHIKPMHN
jgi:hypothetical protein